MKLYASSALRRIVLAVLIGSPAPLAFGQTPAEPTTGFKAPQPTEHAYSLNEALEASFKNTLVRQRWLAADRKARVALTLVRLEKRPTVAASSRVLLYSSSDILSASADVVTTEKERLRFGLTASYRLYDAGKTAAHIRAGEAQIRLTRDTSKTQAIQLLSNVSAAYYRVVLLQREYKSETDKLNAAGEGLRIAKARLGEGLATKGDVMAAQSTFSAAESEGLRRKTNLASGRADLAALMGENPLEYAPTVSDPDRSDPPPGAIEDLVKQANTYNPAYGVLLAMEQAARERYQAVHAERKPEVTLQASAGYAIREKLGTSTFRSGPYFLGFMNVNLPLFNMASIRAREQDALADAEYQSSQKELLLNSLRATIMSAALNLSDADARISAANAAVSSGEEAHRLSLERYKAGRGLQLDVLVALDALSSSRDALAQARCDREVAVQTLRWLTGADALPLPDGFPVGSENTAAHAPSR